MTIFASNIMPKHATPIQSLKKELQKRFPKAKLSLDAAPNSKSASFLDVTLDEHLVLIQWRKGEGFGISCSPEHAYGEGVDEIYEDEEAAFARTVSLLLSKTYTAAPQAIRLPELRKERGVSQMQLASVLAIQQGAVSKLERRHDMLLSTVRQVIHSLGGTLHITVKFPDGMERQLDFTDEGEEKSVKEKSKLATS